MDSENSRLKTLSLQRCTCISTAERNCFVAWEIKYLCCYKMQPWENIKSHKSCKRYGLKTSTSDEVRQGCLHFFPISQSLSPKSACLTDREHPQATSCKPIYHGKPVICNFCSHSAKLEWRLQTKWYGKLCRSVVQGADEVGTESFVNVDFFNSSRTVREHMYGSFD